MNLQIKHLKHYLDCGLLGYHDDDYEYVDMRKITGIHTYGEVATLSEWNESQEWESNNGIAFSRFKPILYPLDYLTKTIWHNGESFVPRIEFETMGGSFYEYQIFFKNFDNKQIHSLPFGAVNKLIEWRFNVFNLPKELIVEVSEDFNPYK